MISLRRLLLSLALGGAASSCALLVPEELGALSCKDEGAVGEPACARGELCQRGECRRCAVAEVCDDGIDNDCNGLRDDGCEPLVGKGGGSAATGGVGGGGAPMGGAGGRGGAGKAGASGKAGGSAGKAGNGGKGGTAGKAGAAGKGGAVGGLGGLGGLGGVLVGGAGGDGEAGESGEGGDAGTSGEGGGAGEAGSGGSGGAPLVLADDGEACVTEADCLYGAVCATISELGGLGTKRVCSRGCRTSAGCQGTAAVCFPTPVGTTVCLRADDVGRADPGEGAVGSPCLAPSECRSGWCAGGFCVDTCATSLDCVGVNGVCVAQKGIPGDTTRTARRCAKGGPGQKGAADVCKAAAECLENDCRTIDSVGALELMGSTCTTACCTTKNCDSVTFIYDDKDVTFGRVCTYEGQMRACSKGNSEVGAGALGSGCKKNEDCRSLFCLEDICSDACCDDSSCADGVMPGLRCLPTQVGNNWQLRCRPP